MFSGPGQADRFVRLARAVFAEHGYECLYADGQLHGADGWTYGLTNVALIACQSPQSEWRDLLERHIRGLETAHATARDRDLGRVGERLLLRLWAHGDRPAPRFSQSFGDGLVGLPAIDHPEYVETLTGPDELTPLGGWDVVRRHALDNLGRLRADEVVCLEEGSDAEVRISIGGFFNASRVLVMPQLLRSDLLMEDPAHGVLFVVPNRHVVAVHQVRGEGLVAAGASLLKVARREFDVPGSMSNDLWFWRAGVVQRVTRPARSSSGVAEFHVRGELELTMRELGLIEDRG